MSSPRPRARQQTIARRCGVRDAPAYYTGSGKLVGSILKHPKDGALSTHPASPPSPRASQLLRRGRASRHDCHALAAHPAHTNPANTRSPFPRQEHAPSQSTPPLELAPSIELAPSFRGEGFGPHTHRASVPAALRTRAMQPKSCPNTPCIARRVVVNCASLTCSSPPAPFRKAPRPNASCEHCDGGDKVLCFL